MGNYGFNAQGYRANNYTPNYNAYAPTPYERIQQQMANSQQPQSYASNQANNAITSGANNSMMSGGQNAQFNGFINGAQNSQYLHGLLGGR